MSGGKSNVDPYYHKDPPKRSKSKRSQSEKKSYRNSVKPKRVEVLPSDKRVYYYDCEHCGKEFTSKVRKHNKHSFCKRTCFDKWQKGRKRDFSGRGFSRRQLEEERKRRSQHMKELWSDPKFRKKTVRAIRKATQTPEFRKKMSKAAKEVASRPEWKEKQSKARKGKTRPPEVGRKISKAKMGHEVSEETRKKLAEAARGDKSYFWKGGVSSKRQRYYRSWTWRKTAEGIKRRDNYTCQGCGWTKDEVAKLGVHHIHPLEDTEYDERNYPNELLVTLCEVCHPKSEYQDGPMKWPINGRDDEVRLERLSNPKSWQTYIDEFSEPDDQ